MFHSTLYASLLLVGSVYGQTCGRVAWTMHQVITNTCPNQITGPEDEGFRGMLNEVLSNGLEKDPNFDCSDEASNGIMSRAQVSNTGGSCVPYTWYPKEKRRLTGSCDQCEGSGVPNDDDTPPNHDDQQTPVYPDGDSGRRLEEQDYIGTMMTYSITVHLPVDKDPQQVIQEVEGVLSTFFADTETARSTWIAHSQRHGATAIDLLTDVTFTKPEVQTDTVSVDPPEETTTENNDASDDSVLIGTWVGASLAGVAMLAAAKYGVGALLWNQQGEELNADDAIMEENPIINKAVVSE